MAGAGSRRLNLGDEEWLEARDYLKLEMARQNIAVNELAGRIGVTSQTIYNVTGETRRPISPKLARGLAQVLGGTVEFWLGSKFPNVSLESPGPDPVQAAIGSGVLTDQQIKKWNEKGDGDGFVISPLNESKIKGASLDLSVGLIVTKGFFQIPKEDRDLWFHFYQIDDTPGEYQEASREYYRTKKEKLGIEFKDKIQLEPGECVHAVAAEMVQMGPRFFCTVGNVNELNLKGIEVLCGSQIDPGFRGPLVFLVKNVLQKGAEPVWLRRGDDIASLTVYALPHPVDQPYAENRLSKISGLIAKLRRAFFAFAESNPENAALREMVEALDNSPDRDKTCLNKLLDRSNDELREAVWEVFNVVVADQADVSVLAAYLVENGDAKKFDLAGVLDKAPMHLGEAIGAIAGNPDKTVAHSESVLRALIDLA